MFIFQFVFGSDRSCVETTVEDGITVIKHHIRSKPSFQCDCQGNCITMKVHMIEDVPKLLCSCNSCGSIVLFDGKRSDQVDPNEFLAGQEVHGYNGDFDHGDKPEGYGIGTRGTDGMSNEPWAIGFVEKYEDGSFWIMDQAGRTHHSMKIFHKLTAEEGAWLAEKSRGMEKHVSLIKIIKARRKNESRDI